MKLLPGRPRRRVLLALVLFVSAAHLALLRTAPSHLGSNTEARTATQAFTTRNVAIVPPEPVAPAPPAPPKRPRPAKPAVPVAAAPETAPEPPAASPAAETSLPADTTTLAAPQAAPAATTADAGSTTTATVGSAPAVTGTTRVTAIGLPDTLRIKYGMTGLSKGLTYHANAELTWNNSGNRYDARMEVSALFLGSRSMSSNGQITPGGLAPERFLDKSRSEQAAHFQPDKGKVTFSANTPDAPWVEGAQDRLSIFMQLGAMLAGDPAAFPPGSSITLLTVGPREAEPWTFVVGGEEKMQLPEGEAAVIRLTRQPRRELDQVVEIWYAPSLGYLPVRNRVTQNNGDFVEQRLSAVIRP